MSGGEEGSGETVSGKVYWETYASSYDFLNEGKDYEAECGLIEEAFREYAGDTVRAVVDFGCGTGGHAIPLAGRGYKVTGVDLSHEMLKVAREKSERSGEKVEWVNGDLRTADAGSGYDAALFMFAVLGYILPNDDVMAAFSNARRHLRKGGLLAFDVWYGPAVISVKPSERIKVITTEKGKVIRAARPELDTRNHRCAVNYHVWTIEGDRVVDECEESHVVRYYFPLEIELMLNNAGFHLDSITAFPTLDQKVDENTWNAFVVAHAV